MLNLTDVFDDDRPPGATACPPDPVTVEPVQPDPAADPTPAAQTPTGWRAELTPAERALYPTEPDPPANHIQAVLAVRRSFGGTIVSVSSPILEPDELPDAWREMYEERSAIREYCGNPSREWAEARAMKETVAAMRAAGEE